MASNDEKKKYWILIRRTLAMIVAILLSIGSLSKISNRQTKQDQLEQELIEIEGKLANYFIYNHSNKENLKNENFSRLKDEQEDIKLELLEIGYDITEGEITNYDLAKKSIKEQIWEIQDRYDPINYKISENLNSLSYKIYDQLQDISKEIDSNSESNIIELEIMDNFIQILDDFNQKFNDYDVYLNEEIKEYLELIDQQDNNLLLILNFLSKVQIGSFSNEALLGILLVSCGIIGSGVSAMRSRESTVQETSLILGAAVGFISLLVVKSGSGIFLMSN